MPRPYAWALSTQTATCGSRFGAVVELAGNIGFSILRLVGGAVRCGPAPRGRGWFVPPCPLLGQAGGIWPPVPRVRRSIALSNWLHIARLEALTIAAAASARSGGPTGTWQPCPLIGC